MIICLPKLPSKEFPVVIETHDKILKRLQEWLASKGKPAIPDIRRLDSIYGLYAMATADKVRGWAKDNMYVGKILGPDIPKDKINPEARDCDNRAEHYAYWMHRALPGCPVVTVTGSKIGKDVWHRYVFVICTDGVMPIEDMGFMDGFRQPIVY